MYNESLLPSIPIHSINYLLFYHACLQLTNQIAPFRGNKLINYLILCREVDKYPGRLISKPGRLISKLPGGMISKLPGIIKKRTSLTLVVF